MPADAPAPGPVVATAAPPQAPSALHVAVEAAAGRTGGLAVLFADLGVALETPGLPGPVAAAAARLVGLLTPLDPPPSGPALKQAMAQSGLFLEAQLASGAAPAAGDLKAALLNLAQALEAWAAPASGKPSASAPAPSAPPYRGAPLRGEPPAPPSLTPQTPADVLADHLMRQTHAALARQVLLQAASLPGASSDGVQGRHWLLDVPVATPQGAAVAQFEIHRDDRREGGEADGEAVWRAGFSLNLDPMGPVHARISLAGGQARVTLWAEDAETAARLDAKSVDLADALKADDLQPQVSVYAGAPATAAPLAGRLVDRAL